MEAPSIAMATQKHQAERLRIGLGGRWIQVRDAIAWADRQIAEASHPHPALIDIALAHNRRREDVEALLAAIPGSVDAVSVMRLCLGDMLEAVERDPRLAADAARWLYHAALREELPEAEFGLEAYAVEDAFSLAEQGIYGTVGEARDRLLAFLREHGESKT